MRESELKELEKEIEKCEKDLEKNTLDIDNVIQRKIQVEDSCKRFDVRMEELRQERQRILALGENPDQINLKIKQAREEHELEEDELIGLTKRLEALKQERSRLRNKKIELRKEYLALQAIPLIKEFNECAEKMGTTILPKLWGILDEIGEPIESNRVVKASTWEAMKVVPRLYLPSESVKDLKDYFRRK